jgi:hypothetical protein
MIEIALNIPTGCNSEYTGWSGPVRGDPRCTHQDPAS